jgi:3-oxoacyl-[acyl-carrier protein] reductase
MNRRFEDQVAIITGGADGLGKGIARRIASEGGRIILFDINSYMLGKMILMLEDFIWMFLMKIQ